MKNTLRQNLSAITILLAAAALLILPREAAAAAREGIDLCLRVVVPSLFPFLVLSALAVSSGAAEHLGRFMDGFMRRVLHLPGQCAIALAVGLIGGFPVGAKTAAALYHQGLCRREDAERLLAFCNNCGPAFIFGFAGGAVLQSARAGLLLYIGQAAAALCAGFLLRPKAMPPSRGAARMESGSRFDPAGAIRGAFYSVFEICAFVLFFSVVSGMLEACGVFSLLGGSGGLLAPLLQGFLEVSKGTAAVGSVSAPLWLKLVLCSVVMGWSGLSVHFQVLSVLEGTGLGLGYYFKGKLLTAGLSALFCGIMGLLLRVESVAAGAGFAAVGAASVSILALPIFLTIIGAKTGNKTNNGL